LVVEEEVIAVRGPQASRAFVIALHLRVRQEYRGLPAGTEILVGYADAGASVPDPTSLTMVDPLAAPDAPIEPIAATYAGDTQDPPPGGFTATGTSSPIR
jgi:hypothetical protein